MNGAERYDLVKPSFSRQIHRLLQGIVSTVTFLDVNSTTCTDFFNAQETPPSRFSNCIPSRPANRNLVVLAYTWGWWMMEGALIPDRLPRARGRLTASVISS